MTHLFRISKYVSVALLSAASDWLVFAAMVAFLDTSHLLALVVARCVGGVVSFLSNRYWTWGGNRQVTLTKQGFRFVMLYLVSYATSIAEFFLLNTVLGLSPYAAKLITDCTCFVINYLVMNGFVFRSSNAAIAESPVVSHERNA